MSEIKSDDLVSIGEGFAFACWHRLHFPLSECKGWDDPYNACDSWWRQGRR